MAFTFAMHSLGSEGRLERLIAERQRGIQADLSALTPDHTTGAAASALVASRIRHGLMDRKLAAT